MAIPFTLHFLDKYKTLQFVVVANFIWEVYGHMSYVMLNNMQDNIDYVTVYVQDTVGDSISQFTVDLTSINLQEAITEITMDMHLQPTFTTMYPHYYSRELLHTKDCDDNSVVVPIMPASVYTWYMSNIVGREW